MIRRNATNSIGGKETCSAAQRDWWILFYQAAIVVEYFKPIFSELATISTCSLKQREENNLAEVTINILAVHEQNRHNRYRLRNNRFLIVKIVEFTTRYIPSANLDFGPISLLMVPGAAACAVVGVGSYGIERLQPA